MKCRVGCAACCIAPSISSPIPGMEGGKPAGVRCIQLTDDGRCRIFGRAERPPVCLNLKADKEMCGAGTDEALGCLAGWEELTRPNARIAVEVAPGSAVDATSSLQTGSAP